MIEITKEFYEWCLAHDGGNTTECSYEDFLVLCDDRGSWFDEIKPLYDEYISTLC